jgi:general stress protein 26
MSKEDRSKHLLNKLLQTQRLAVLATQGDDGPYTSLMAIASTDDLKHLIFAAERASRKFANIMQNPRVALLIDDRTADSSDFRSNIAVTAVGKAAEMVGIENEHLQEVFLTKHPDLKKFVEEPACALLACAVERYYIVSNFREVIEFRPERADPLTPKGSLSYFSE